jgi:hypothetical protein
MNLKDIRTLTTLFGIIIAGSFIMDFDSTIDVFKSVIKFIDDIIRRINRL